MQDSESRILDTAGSKGINGDRQIERQRRNEKQKERNQTKLYLNQSIDFKRLIFLLVIKVEHWKRNEQNIWKNNRNLLSESGLVCDIVINGIVVFPIFESLMVRDNINNTPKYEREREKKSIYANDHDSTVFTTILSLQHCCQFN